MIFHRCRSFYNDYWIITKVCGRPKITTALGRLKPPTQPSLKSVLPNDRRFWIILFYTIKSSGRLFSKTVCFHF